MKAMLKTFDELSNLELYDILRLRSEIFVVEQQSIYNDPDGYDIDAYHLIIEDNASVVAALRILPEKTRFEDISIGRLVVKKQYRGKGLARKIMEIAMKFIINDLKKDTIRLSGQTYLSEFYTSLGFSKVSAEYLEDGIPHNEFLYENVIS